VDALLEQGNNVRVFDKLISQVHPGNRPQYLPSDVEFVTGSMTDRIALVKALTDVNKVVHLAAEVGVGQSMYEISRYVSANTLGTSVLLDVIANEKNSVSKIVVASSMSIYGEGSYSCEAHGPIAPRLRSDAQLHNHDWEPRCPRCKRDLSPVATPESKPLYPSSVYAITKMDQELLCLAVGRAYGIGVTALRYFNAYGPRQSLCNPYTGVAAIFSSRLLNGQAPLVNEDGRQMRDFIHVTDVARATVAALRAPQTNGRAINIGIGEPISILEVATVLAEELGLEIKPVITGTYRAGDIRHCWADPTEAQKLLGFRPLYRMRGQGVKDLTEWVRSQIPVDGGADAVAELKRRGLTV
jgi:dTDP-L-rhamnose 4-epimerase